MQGIPSILVSNLADLLDVLTYLVDHRLFPPPVLVCTDVQIFLCSLRGRHLGCFNAVSLIEECETNMVKYPFFSQDVIILWSAPQNPRAARLGASPESPPIRYFGTPNHTSIGSISFKLLGSNQMFALSYRQVLFHLSANLGKAQQERRRQCAEQARHRSRTQRLPAPWLVSSYYT